MRLSAGNWRCSVLLGSELPRLFTPPARPLTPATTRGYECIAFAEDVLSLDLMPWQRWALLHALELAPDGSFRFRTLVILCARQQGKSTLLQVLALWRLYVDRAGLVIGTAQQLSMAEETWDGAVSMAEGVPDLAAELDHVSRVNGSKFMRLTTGERYAVTASSRRGGRGLSSDLVLLDELREHHDWDAWAAVTKTTMARPSPQVVGFSNAGDARSIVLAALRDKALVAAADRSTTLGILEWSAPDDCDLDDLAGWQAANPALGHRVTAEAIRAARLTDPEDVFRTEVLCQWVSALDTALDAGAWASLADPDAPRGTDIVFSLDLPADHSTATIAAAWRRSDGHVQVVILDHREGVEWVTDRARDLLHNHGGRLIIEQSGTGAFLLPALRDVTVDPVPRRYFVDACASLDAAVTARTVRHGDDPPVRAAVDVARWSAQADTGQRVLSRRDPRVSPLVAVALALHGVASTVPKRRPGRFVSF